MEVLPTVHVRLDVRGIQRTVIDPNLVDAALEELAPDAVPAQAKRASRHLGRPGLWALRDLDAVDVEPCVVPS